MSSQRQLGSAPAHQNLVHIVVQTVWIISRRSLYFSPFRSAVCVLFSLSRLPCGFIERTNEKCYGDGKRSVSHKTAKGNGESERSERQPKKHSLIRSFVRFECMFIFFFYSNLNFAREDLRACQMNWYGFVVFVVVVLNFCFFCSFGAKSFFSSGFSVCGIWIDRNRKKHGKEHAYTCEFDDIFEAWRWSYNNNSNAEPCQQQL